MGISFNEQVFTDAMKYCTITPNRGGERNELFQFCLKQLKKMNGGHHVTNAYIMNDRPISDQCDLIPRVKYAVDLAIRDGYEWAFVTESDDAYQENHFDRYSRYFDSADFIGDSGSYYYNIFTNRWQLFKHPGRSSLFTTAFRLSALSKFIWPPDNYIFLDQPLWKYAKKYRCKFVDSGAIGIKHNIGKCGGKGHKMTLRNHDSDGSFLKSKLSDYHIDFYEEYRRKMASG